MADPARKSYRNAFSEIKDTQSLERLVSDLQRRGYDRTLSALMRRNDIALRHVAKSTVRARPDIDQLMAVEVEKRLRPEVREMTTSFMRLFTKASAPMQLKILLQVRKIAGKTRSDQVVSQMLNTLSQYTEQPSAVVHIGNYIGRNLHGLVAYSNTREGQEMVARNMNALSEILTIPRVRRSIIMEAGSNSDRRAYRRIKSIIDGYFTLT